MGHRSVVRQTLHYFARPHTSVPTHPVGGPAAWTTSTVGRWRETLTATQADELDAAVASARATGKPTARLEASDLPLPTLGRDIERWRAQLVSGRGFVVLSGVPVDRWSEADRERFFWGFGLHLGIPGAQNPQGDLLGHVRDQGYDHQTDVRAYRTRTAIRFHCDTADVVGLFCLTPALRGGRSRICSSVTVFDALVSERPDLAAALFSPFELDTKAEGGVRHFPIEPCRYDGQLRTFYHADYFRSASRHPDVEALGTLQAEALDRFDALADENCLEMDLAPGDIQLLNNHTQVHSRTAFENGDTERHLLRLWLSLDNGGGGATGPWLRLLARFARARLSQR